MRQDTFVYSEKIVTFIHKIKLELKFILSKEVGLKVYGNRFYDKKREYSYPIQVVIFNDRPMLGYFDPHFYELGFNECLMHTSKEKLRDLIRHEVAHYLTFISFGNEVNPHGKEFRTLCEKMGWSKEVWKATTCLDDQISLPGEKENAVLRKAQKLLALSTSSNSNEAEQAVIKSQQLLLKHNLKNTQIDEEKFFLKRILKHKKKSAKVHAIAKILETFFINAVYNRQGGFTYLEIVGEKTNVEIAEYVAKSLDLQLEQLWKQSGLKGTIAKNSFYLGLAQGYCEKIYSFKVSSSKGLIALEKKLEIAKEMAYPRLSSVSSHARFCSHSSDKGKKVGKELTIRPGIKSNSDTKLLQVLK